MSRRSNGFKQARRHAGGVTRHVGARATERARTAVLTPFPTAERAHRRSANRTARASRKANR